MEHVNFIVMLPGADRIALVSADVTDEWLMTEEGLKAAISRGVAEWLSRSAVGKRALEETHGQLTIETIGDYFGDPILVIMLVAEGVHNLRVTTIRAGDSGTWRLTDLLCDQENIDATNR